MRIARWREKFDQIPADTKDPGLLKARKAMERKRPKRRDSEQYWNEPQFQKLVAAPAGKLSSRGPLPWRLLAYMLDASPEVDLIRRLVGKRLMDSRRLESAQRELDRMLLTLHRGGYVRLEPSPPEKDAEPPSALGVGAEEGAQGSGHESIWNRRGAAAEPARRPRSRRTARVGPCRRRSWPS